MSGYKDYGRNVLSFIKSFPLLFRSRIEPIFLWTWSAAIACMVAGRGFPPLNIMLMTLTSTILVTASVYIYNDVVDADMDKLNVTKISRPLVNGSVSTSLAYIFICLTGLLGLGLAYLINLNTFLISLSWWILFFLYSYPPIRLKKKFLVKEITTSSGQIFNALIGSYAITNTLNITVVFAGLIFWLFTFLGLPAFADTLDQKEDELFKVKTLARVLSWRRKVQLMGIGVLLMMTVLPLTYSRLGLSVLLPIFLVVSSLVLLRWVIFPTMNTNYTTLTVLRTRKLVTIYLLIAQIVLIISSMNLGLI
ncbi:MAG: UbiA family prenyltransferase [Candidatus Bathyarchaeia archaeon]